MWPKGRGWEGQQVGFHHDCVACDGLVEDYLLMWGCGTGSRQGSSPGGSGGAPLMSGSDMGTDEYLRQEQGIANFLQALEEEGGLEAEGEHDDGSGASGESLFVAGVVEGSCQSRVHCSQVMNDSEGSHIVQMKLMIPCRRPMQRRGKRGSARRT
jgi:hypothetical protein